MEKFDIKIQEIEEALSFSKTFKTPNRTEKSKRKMEIFEEPFNKAKKTRLSDGSWQIDGDFDISHRDIESLKKLQELNISIITGDFDCSSNLLTSLVGCPKEVKGNFICMNNYKYFKINYIQSLCKVGGYHLNEL